MVFTLTLYKILDFVVNVESSRARVIYLRARAMTRPHTYTHEANS